VFGEQEWDSELAPLWMVGCLRALEREPNQRKRRLLYTATARIGFRAITNSPFNQAIKLAEEWADSGRPRFGEDDLCKKLRRRMPRRGSVEWEWRYLALESLDSHPSLYVDNFQDETRHVFADAYRELFPNPFVPLEWNPDWFTSTVRDLAARIYERREFELMPILGDALLDAGCDHQLIQDHCRSSKPHARGCWVLDGILGKT
jgi:hypothetical protein